MGLFWKSEFADLETGKNRDQAEACAGFSIEFLAGHRDMITTRLKPMPPFSSITSRAAMHEYYESHLGQASGKVFPKENDTNSGIMIERERLTRWIPKLLPRLLHEAPEGYATMCFIESSVTLFSLYFKWEADGYGETLRREMERLPVDHTNEDEYQERQWLLDQLKEFNLLLIQTLRSHPNIPFTPNPKLIQ